MQSLIAITLATLGMGFAWYFALLMLCTFSTPMCDMKHKLGGLVPKPVIITNRSDGSRLYGVRVYALWGLRKTKWFLAENSRHNDWNVYSIDRTRTVCFKSSEDVVLLMRNLTPPEKQVTVESHTIEELKMEDLLEDKG